MADLVRQNIFIVIAGTIGAAVSLVLEQFWMAIVLGCAVGAALLRLWLQRSKTERPPTSGAGPR
jgi:uncharacterized membrane protein YfcA